MAGEYPSLNDRDFDLLKKITDNTAQIVDGGGGGGSGTVTSVSVVTANGVSGTVANPTTTPAITLTVAPAVGSITGLGANVATFLATPSSANLAAAVTGETGTGALVFGTSPTLVTPVLGTPASGNLSNTTVDGTNSIGFRGVPQNSQSSAYTTVLADSGKEIYHPVGDANARTFTIDSNANVPYPVGTVIIFTNMSASAVTIAITSDTLYLFGAGTTGSRTLAQYGTAAARKLTTTTWGISGTNLT